MPSALPEGEPAPADGSLPASRRWPGVGERPFGVYVHVPFCTVRCGYCDFNTYTSPTRDGHRRAGRLPDDVRRGRGRGGPAGAAGARRPRRAGRDGLLRRRHADPAQPGRPRVGAGARSTREFGLAPGAEVTTEANPDSVTKADLVALREAGFTRISFGMQSAVDHVLTVLDRTHDPAAGARRRRLGAGGRLRAGQPGPDLRHAGGVAGRLGGLARRGAGLRARPRVGVLPDRRGRHRAGPAGPARRAADARRGRPRRQVRRGRRAARRRRAELVRGLQLGPRRRGPVPAQPPLLDRRRLVGGRPGRALPRRRRALVERPAPRGVRRPARRRPSARRTPARCSTPRPGGSSGCCSSCGCATGCRSTSSTRPAAPPSPTRSSGGLVARRRRPAGAHAGAGGCWPTASCGTCSP